MSDPAAEVLANARRWGVLVGDCGDTLRSLPAGCVHTCVTSPPYYGLRSYLPKDHPDKAKEIGLEETPESYIARMVAVFREVRRVLRSDGTLWVNIADSYSSANRNGHGVVVSEKQLTNNKSDEACRPRMPPGIKPKDRIGIPHMLAFALRADGWYWRDEVVWSKVSPMPESVRDRTTRSHEFVFLFTKSARYFYDAEAIAERSVSTHPAGNKKSVARGRIGPATGWDAKPNPEASVPEFRNKRSVWRLNAKPYKGSHYAVMPPKLVEPCVLAGTSAKGCCPACGAPWVRAVARERVATRPGANTKVMEARNKMPAEELGRARGAARFEKSTLGSVVGNRDPRRHVTRTETVGWGPGCGCGGGLPADALEVIATPTGERAGDDPSQVVGRAGFSRPRGDAEGVRPITRYEQRKYAGQLRASAHKAQMAEEAGPAFAHYVRTDRSGARPIPADLLARWVGRGWLTPVEVPTGTPPHPVPCLVLDPFVGSGTTLAVAAEHGRRGLGCDLDERNLDLIRGRMGAVQPVLAGLE